MEGVKVYAPDAEHMWLPGVICQVRDGGKRVSVRLENLVSPTDTSALEQIPAERELRDLQGSERNVDFSDPVVLKALQALNSASSGATNGATLTLPLQNASDSSATSMGFEDMITIDHLHEASILHNLRRRFFRKLPYTYTGKICIAVNPYQWLNLYDASVMDRFRDGSREHKPPHVYAVSMEAFFNMRTRKEDQSILVSGESGAGKTETTKIVMSHLAALAANANAKDSKVIQQIIKANPLLESFGNAKTVRNDNSSRFGKFTELQFTSDGQLIGARSRTYLLEKSRVTTQASGERNFHIFYQLLRQRAAYPELSLAPQQTFKYVSQHDDNGVVLDEEGDLDRTREALELIGIEAALQHEILAILAAVLHLGETSFCAVNGDVDASQLVDRTPFATACALLGVDVAALERAVCNRNVVVGREVFLKPMTSVQAADCRDALAKTLYSKLFLWLVDRINETIGVKTGGSGTAGSTSASSISFIGILDIFGFEHFEHNSFEQFCINYANEKLQQKFVQDVLKTVQLEYEEENISWNHVTFADNQDVLNLIEGRLGVISFLNEESLLATGSDAAFASKLGAVMENNPLLETPRLNQCAFAIYHYAGKVTYDATGFLDKHRDAILPDIKQCMSTSTLSILSRTFADDAAGAAGAGTVAAAPVRGAAGRKRAQAQPKRTTVGTQFKESLSQLMDKISLTDVHYVRCLKPNALKSAHCFSHGDIVNQLRCAGVIEAIRVSRSAYPSRLPHVECVKKFRVLLSDSATNASAAAAAAHSNNDDLNSMSDAEMKRECERVMAKLLPGSHIIDYQVGTTRVYFRESVLEALETKRALALRKFAIVLQTSVRGFLVRRRYVRMKRQAVVIQKYWRRFVLRRRFVQLQHGVIRLQAHWRGQLARKRFRAMKFDHSIVRFQALYRGFVVRRAYLRKLTAVKRLQGFSRFTLLRLVFLRKMETEKKYKALGSKVAQLQLKLDRKHVVSPVAASGGGARLSPSGTKARGASVTGGTTDAAALGAGTSGAPGTGGSASLRGSMLNANTGSSSSNYRFSASSGILDESQEVITALHDENERLRKAMEQQEAEIQKLRSENRTLKNWQKSKEVDEKVQKMAHRDQESKDLTYLSALEAEYEKLRSYICDTLELPGDLGSIIMAAAATAPAPAAGGATGAAPGAPPAGSNLRSSFVAQTSDKALLAGLATTTGAGTGASSDPRSAEAQHLILKSAARIAHAKSRVTSKGSARRVKEQWEEIRNFPPPMQFTLGSVPWKRLLTDWAQGNSKKLDYMTRWLKNVLDGGPIVSDTFPMGVELKYVTPMMLDGFMQLIIPKLAERPDIQVHVHTKEFIGTSMRITLSQLEKSGGSGNQRADRSPPMEVEDFQRISILANSGSGMSGRFSNASTLSLSPSDSSLLSGSGTSAPGRSSLFRSGRSSESRTSSNNGSFFQSRKR